MECFKNWHILYSPNNKKLLRKSIKLKKFFPKEDIYYNLYNQ